MNTHAVYKLAVQAQLASALRELMYIAIREENQPLTELKAVINADGFIDVTEIIAGGMEISGYGL